MQSTKQLSFIPKQVPDNCAWNVTIWSTKIDNRFAFFNWLAVFVRSIPTSKDMPQPVCWCEG